MQTRILVLAGLALILLSGAAGFGGGWLAATLHPTPGLTGPAGPPGPQGQMGPRGLTTIPAASTTGGFCSRIETTEDFNAIPPRTYVTNVQLWPAPGGRCIGGTFIPVG